MWTQIRWPSAGTAGPPAPSPPASAAPAPASAALIASSKSFAVTGSIVNVGRPRRSRRGGAPAPESQRAAGPSAPATPSASMPTSRAIRRGSPRSSSSASSTSRATSGAPISRATRWLRDRRPPPPGTNSPIRPSPSSRAPLSTLTWRPGRPPSPNSGSATKNLPRRRRIPTTGATCDSSRQTSRGSVGWPLRVSDGRSPGPPPAGRCSAARRVARLGPGASSVPRRPFGPPVRGTGGFFELGPGPRPLLRPFGPLRLPLTPPASQPRAARSGAPRRRPSSSGRPSPARPAPAPCRAPCRCRTASSCRRGSGPSA
ncbi:unannotated protein [freshwater metagenome]|uniref:Unannotated protein n=1 Tax=freshwater metagenome TaxID=449393 RepID=A0A6J7KLU5_9ZZZZ